MLSDILSQSVGILLPAFLMTAMLSLGLGLTAQQIMRPLRDTQLVARSLVVSILLVPLVALAITAVIPLDPAFRIGILLFACAAGVEAGPKFVEITGGNAAFAFGLLSLQLIVTITFVPVFLGFIAPEADIRIGMLILKLSLLIALPVAAGGIINARYEEAAARLKPLAHHTSMVLMWTVFVILIFLNSEAIRSLPSNALLAAALFFLLAFCLGYAGGGPTTGNRRALAMMSFGRSGGIGMMLAGQVFVEDPGVLLMTTLMTAASVVAAVLFLAGQRGIDTLAERPGKAIHEYGGMSQ